METLDLQIVRENAVVIFTVKGRVDGNTSESFAQFMSENILVDDKIVILDLSDMAFISSAGMRQFMKLAKRLDKSRLKANLVGMNSSVAQTFEIAGFNSLFHRHPTVASVLSPAASEPRKSLFSQFFNRKAQ